MTQEALKLAEIALDDIEHQRFSWRRFDALVAIKQALAQPESDDLTAAYMSGLYDGRKEELQACIQVCENLGTWAHMDEIINSLKTREKA